MGPDGNLGGKDHQPFPRLSDTCYTYYYRNGERVLQGQQMLDLPDTLLAGLALAANEPGLMARSAFSGVNFVSIPISCERVFPIDEFTPGQPISGIQVRASIPVGVTSSAVITETPPAGWSISNVQATAGDVSVTTEAIVWSLDNASGNPVLTYDVTPLQDAVTGQWSGSVSLSDLTFPVPNGAPVSYLPMRFCLSDRQRKPGITPKWCVCQLAGRGANRASGRWNIRNSFPVWDIRWILSPMMKIILKMPGKMWSLTESVTPEMYSLR